MPVAAAIVGSAVVGAGASIYSSSKASKAASKASDKNAQILNEQYNQTRQDLAPYNRAGQGALGAINNYYGLGGEGRSSGNPRSAIGGDDGPLMNGSGGGYGAYKAANADLAAEASRTVASGQFPNEAAYFAWHDANYGNEGRSSYTDPAAGGGSEDGGYDGPTYDDGTGNPRPTGGDRPTAGREPQFGDYYDTTPTQQYYDALSSSTRGINAGAGFSGSYFSGGRAKSLQSNANKLWREDEDRRFQRANTLYSQAQGQYNADRQFANSNYDVDQARSDARYDTDRAYTTGRTDTRTNDLFRLVGIGQNAASATANAGQNYASGSVSNNNNLASTQGNAALAGASGVNNVLGSALTAYGMYSGGGSGATYGNTLARSGNYYGGSYGGSGVPY